MSSIKWEAEWWGTCQNTYGEEFKQLLYAKKMGLGFFHDGKSPFNIYIGGLSILDIGGGPTSLLLKCARDNTVQRDMLVGICVTDGCSCVPPPHGTCMVVDPLPMPQWVVDRYTAAGIEVVQARAEDIHLALPVECYKNRIASCPDPICEGVWDTTEAYKDPNADYVRKPWDEVWVYNVLQHVENPEKVVENCKKAGKLIKLFEWIDTPTNVGHPHSLSEGMLNVWLGGEGRVEDLKGQNECYGRAYYGIFPTGA